MNTAIRYLTLTLIAIFWIPFVCAQETTTNLETLVSDGNLYLQQGDCQVAQYFFQEALKLDQSLPEGLIGRGRSLACQGNYQLAAEDFRQAIEGNPDIVSAYVQLSLVYVNQFVADSIRFPNRLRDALTVIEKAEGFAPKSAQVLNTKGVVLYQLGNLAIAHSTLLEAAERATNPNSGLKKSEQSRVLVNLARTYRDKNNLDLAVSTLRRAIVFDPTNATARNTLGNVYYRIQPRNCREAQYELAQAVALAPNSLSAISQLGIVTFECGSINTSVHHLEAGVAMDSSVLTPPLYTYLARAYLAQGNFAEAIKRAQQGALLPPASAEAYYYLGIIYSSRGESDDSAAAKRAFEKALEIDPEYREAQDALGTL